MTTFWLGAGAAAAVILAVLGVLQYARSGSNLVVSVRQYEFELPAPAQQAFAQLAERISPWSDALLVVIGEVRPGESVKVLAWGPRVSEEPSVTQRKGRAVVRVLKMVRSRWVRLAQVELVLLVFIVLYVVIRLMWLH